MQSADGDGDSKKSNKKDGPPSPLAKPLDDSADQYFYLQIPKSEIDNSDIRKILPDTEKENDKDKQSETSDKSEKKDIQTEATPLTPPPSVTDGDLNTSVALTCTDVKGPMQTVQTFNQPQIPMSPGPSLVPVHYQVPVHPVPYVPQVAEEIVTSNINK